MLSKPRGLVLIIDNEDFVNGVMDKRQGSDVDSANLEVLFKELGFEVAKGVFTLAIFLLWHK